MEKLDESEISLTNIIIGITLSLLITMVLSYTFGRLICKAIVKEKHKENREAIDQSHNEIDKARKKIEELEQFVRSKDHTIDKLMTQLSRSEDKLSALEKEHEAEINAFLDDRDEITKRYKETL